jgi:hypothetical protein
MKSPNDFGQDLRSADRLFQLEKFAEASSRNIMSI